MMECEKFNNLISGYIDGELSPEEKASFEEHVGSCEECAALIEDFNALDGMMRETEDFLPDEAYWSGFDARLREKVDKLEEKKAWWKFPFLKGVFKPIAAIAMGLLLFVGLLAGPFRSMLMHKQSDKAPMAPNRRASVSVRPEKPAVDKELNQPKPAAMEPDKNETLTEDSAIQPADEEAEGGLKDKASGDPEDEKPAGSIANAVRPKAKPKTESADSDKEVIPSPLIVDRDDYPKAAPGVYHKVEQPPMMKTSKAPKAPVMPDDLKMDKFSGGGGTSSNGYVAGKSVTKPDTSGFDKTAPAKPQPQPAPMEKKEVYNEPDAQPEAITKAPSLSLDTVEGSKKARSTATGGRTRSARKGSGNKVGSISNYIARSEAILLMVLNVNSSDELAVLKKALIDSNFHEQVKTLNRIGTDHRLAIQAREMDTITQDILDADPAGINRVKHKISESGILEYTRELRE